jgi:uncharacterized cupin superfamily protein
MPKVDIGKAKVRTGTNYPPQFQNVVQGREKSVLGDLVGLTQFGVNLTRLKPGAASALRHWHENEDEFVYILEGELVLIEDEGETLLRPGDAAGFKAGVANGHHLVNKTQRDAVYLEIGTRAPTERAHYPDVDLEFIRDKDKVQVRHKSGEPYT